MGQGGDRIQTQLKRETTPQKQDLQSQTQENRDSVTGGVVCEESECGGDEDEVVDAESRLGEHDHGVNFKSYKKVDTSVIITLDDGNSSSVVGIGDSCS